MVKIVDEGEDFMELRINGARGEDEELQLKVE